MGPSECESPQQYTMLPILFCLLHSSLALPLHIPRLSHHQYLPYHYLHTPPSPASQVWVTSCLPRQTCLPGWSQTVKHSTISVVPRKVGSPARRPAGITTTVLDLACSSASPSVLEAPSTRLPPGSASLRTR